MSNGSNPDGMEQPFLPEIRRGRFDQLTIYEVTDSELEILERGSPDSLFLNFAIFLWSCAASFSTTLATTTIPSNRTFTVFVVLTSIGYVGGVILLFLWRRDHQPVSRVVSTIRRRVPPQGIAEAPPR